MSNSIHQLALCESDEDSDYEGSAYGGSRRRSLGAASARSPGPQQRRRNRRSQGGGGGGRAKRARTKTPRPAMSKRQRTEAIVKHRREQCWRSIAERAARLFAQAADVGAQCEVPEGQLDDYFRIFDNPLTHETIDITLAKCDNAGNAEDDDDDDRVAPAAALPREQFVLTLIPSNDRMWFELFLKQTEDDLLPLYLATDADSSEDDNDDDDQSLRVDNRVGVDDHDDADDDDGRTRLRIMRTHSSVLLRRIVSSKFQATTVGTINEIFSPDAPTESGWFDVATACAAATPRAYDVQGYVDAGCALIAYARPFFAKLRDSGTLLVRTDCNAEPSQVSTAALAERMRDAGVLTLNWPALYTMCVHNGEPYDPASHVVAMTLDKLLDSFPGLCEYASMCYTPCAASSQLRALHAAHRAAVAANVDDNEPTSGNEPTTTGLFGWLDDDTDDDDNNDDDDDAALDAYGRPIGCRNADGAESPGVAGVFRHVNIEYADVAHLFSSRTPLWLCPCSAVLYHDYSVLHGQGEVLWRFAKFLEAHLLQNPREKPTTCIFYLGAFRIGKDLLAKVIREIIGDLLSCGAERLELLTGKFNSYASGKLYVVLDEQALDGISRAQMNVLKHLITEDMLSMQRKGADPVEELNVFRMRLHGNDLHKSVFLREVTGRVTIADVCDSIVTCLSGAGDTKGAYFTKLASTHADDKRRGLRIRALWYYRLALGADYNPKADALVTDTMRHLSQRQLPYVLRWFQQCLYESRIVGLQSVSAVSAAAETSATTDSSLLASSHAGMRWILGGTVRNVVEIGTRGLLVSTDALFEAFKAWYRDAYGDVASSTKPPAALENAPAFLKAIAPLTNIGVVKSGVRFADRTHRAVCIAAPRNAIALLQSGDVALLPSATIADEVVTAFHVTLEAQAQLDGLSLHFDNNNSNNNNNNNNGANNANDRSLAIDDTDCDVETLRATLATFLYPLIAADSIDAAAAKASQLALHYAQEQQQCTPPAAAAAAAVAEPNQTTDASSERMRAWSKRCASASGSDALLRRVQRVNRAEIGAVQDEPTFAPTVPRSRMVCHDPWQFLVQEAARTNPMNDAALDDDEKLRRNLRENGLCIVRNAPRLASVEDVVRLRLSDDDYASKIAPFLGRQHDDDDMHVDNNNNNNNDSGSGLIEFPSAANTSVDNAYTFERVVGTAADRDVLRAVCRASKRPVCILHYPGPEILYVSPAVVDSDRGSGSGLGTNARRTQNLTSAYEAWRDEQSNVARATKQAGARDLPDIVGMQLPFFRLHDLCTAPQNDPAFFHPECLWLLMRRDSSGRDCDRDAPATFQRLKRTRRAPWKSE